MTISEILFRPLFSKKKSHGREVSTVDFRTGKYTVVLYDDENRTWKTFENCTAPLLDKWDVQFTDEMGMRHRWCGMNYSCVENM